ncbi:MAG: hypothetical protein DCC68_01950 [Planctomycetota bacterium]|nr:MAG: hypothetical protein DCC68_01950 [Planctomycetota bacterium]
MVLASLVVGIALGAYAWYQIDDRVRREVEARLAEHYAPLGLEVSVGDAEVTRDGIDLRRVAITDPKLKGNAARLAEIESIHAECDFDPQRLLHGEIRVLRLVLTRPTIRAVQLAEGRWTVDRLWPPPKLSKLPHPPLPAIEIDDGAVELSFAAGSAYRRFRVQDVELTLAPNGPPLPNAPPVSPERLLTLSAQGSGDVVRRIRAGGWVHPDSKSWHITGGVDGLDLNGDLVALAAAHWPQAAPNGEVRGSVDLDFSSRRIVTSAKSPPPPEFEFHGKLTGGHVDDRRLPNPVTDIAARFRYDREGASIEQATARFGSAELTASLTAKRGPGCYTVDVAANATNVTAERQWIDALPRAGQDVWRKFLPEGQADVTFHAAFDGARWTPFAQVDFRDTSFAYHKFPYRARNAFGRVEWRNNAITVDATAYVAGRPVRLRSKTVNPGPNYTGWAEVTADRIDMSEELLAAMPEKAAKVIRSLAGRGYGSFYGRFERPNPDSPTVHHRMTIGVDDAAIRYEKFPLSIEGIRGALTAVDNHWTWDNLHAAGIRSSGEWIPDGDSGRLVVRIDADNVALDEPLRVALPPAAQQAWYDLRPRGVLDAVNVQVDWHARARKLDLIVDAAKHPPRPGAASVASLPTEPISAEPSWFPVRFENVTGQARYRNGRITFSNLQANRGRARVTASAACDHTPDGAFRVQIDQLNVERLDVDRELIAAAPGKLRTALARLSLSEPIDVRGGFGVSRYAAPAPPAATASVNPARADRIQPFRPAAQEPPRAAVAADWDLTFMLQGNSLDAGVKLDNLHGEVRLVGQQAADGVMACLGNLDLDAASFRGIQFGQIQGPLEITDKQILFGTRARRFAPGEKPAPLTARLFGGTVTGDAVVALGDHPTFWLAAQLANGDVRQYALEMIPGRQQVSGRVFASTQLWGGEELHALRGEGRIRLRDADVYQLPVMVAMLKVLSVRAPDATAFTDGDIDYRVEGNHVYLDRINVKGDAISLLGRGEANLDRQIKLNFYTVVGRDEWQLPIVRPLLGEASRQMMQIRVDGTLDNPQVKPEAFPEAKQFLQQVQADLARSTDGQDVLAPAREVLRRTGETLR